MRGLAVFISDIRNCKSQLLFLTTYEVKCDPLGKSREAELRRINKELTNIRQRFRGLQSDSEALFYQNKPFSSSG